MNKNKFYVIKLEDVKSIMSGERVLLASDLINESCIIRKVNEIILNGNAPVIIATSEFLVKTASVESNSFYLKNPKDFGIEGTTANETYSSIIKYSKENVISKIAENTNDLKKVINLYNKIIVKAKKLNIKNAEEASLMTAIKKSGVNNAF
ncbi:MAG TPA: hypothetical protein VMX17_16900 [Candidatus Glassbacteria bacterium]|nr:hypothetical protein [Candidatus Glassbacteria bacterium]